MIIRQPIMLTDRIGQFDVMATVSGGGLSGQAGALRHGISKALTYYEPGLRTVLKRNGFLTRDSRVVERKKYGKREGPPELPVLEALDASQHPADQGRACEAALSFSLTRHAARADSLPLRSCHRNLSSSVLAVKPRSGRAAVIFTPCEDVIGSTP